MNTKLLQSIFYTTYKGAMDRDDTETASSVPSRDKEVGEL